MKNNVNFWKIIKMINLNKINGGFSSIYRLQVDNFEKVIKVINKDAITRFNRNNYHQDN